MVLDLPCRERHTNIMQPRTRQIIVSLLIAFLAVVPLRVASSSPSVDTMDPLGAVSAMSDTLHAAHCETGGGEAGCADSGCGMCAACSLALPFDHQMDLPLAESLSVVDPVNDLALHRSFPPFRPPRA